MCIYVFWSPGARRPVQARHIHIRSYRLILRYPGREETSIYIVTVESPWLDQARHSHLCSCSENLKNVYVYYAYVVMPVVSVGISVSWLRCISYTGPWDRILFISASCHLVAICGTFSQVTSFAIWWPSVELESGSVTFVSDELIQFLKKCEIYRIY
jgi:hypothetical protein